MTSSPTLRRRVFELIIFVTFGARHISMVIGEWPTPLATMDASEILVIAPHFDGARVYMTVETGWHFFAVRSDGRLALWQVSVFVVGMNIFVLMAAFAQSASRNRFVKALKLIRATSSMATTAINSSVFPS